MAAGAVAAIVFWAESTFFHFLVHIAVTGIQNAFALRYAKANPSETPARRTLILVATVAGSGAALCAIYFARGLGRSPRTRAWRSVAWGVLLLAAFVMAVATTSWLRSTGLHDALPIVADETVAWTVSVR